MGFFLNVNDDRIYYGFKYSKMKKVADFNLNKIESG